jgi:primosomal protein N' (replication factor Y) (superfamily II helicase)
MGEDGARRRARGGIRLTARIVPVVPTFSVDEGFRYAIPDNHRDSITIGSMVRVPLGGRKVAGFVVALEDGPTEGLKPVAAVSGAAPVFDSTLADVMRWASRHYVAPLSVMLARCAPPNLPPRKTAGPVDMVAAVGDHPLVEAVSAGTPRPIVWLDAGDPAEWIGPVGSALVGAGLSMMVVVPTGEEVSSIARRLGALGDHLIVVDHEMDDAAVTAAWGRAHHHGGVLVGTPRISSWHLRAPGVFAVVEESRRAMKDRQTPTVHVREMLTTRAARTGVPVIFAGPAPSLEVIARTPEIRRTPGRIWPLVEVVDRREDPPGVGMLAERTRQAVQITVARGGTVFVFAHRRGYSAASRCSRCRALRRCPACGSRPDPEPNCRRCGQALGPCTECGAGRFEPLGAGIGRVVEELGRIVGRDHVGEHPTSRQVSVGTERDLTTLGPQHLTVLVDIDGLILGIDYRAAEEAFRIGTRLAASVHHGSGRRLIVQTNDPEHPVIVALRRADPTAFTGPELENRRLMGYPPYGSLMVIEARGGEPDAADRELRAIAGQAQILGPATSRTGTRWLIQGGDLASFKRDLRPVLQRLRDSGLTMRVDVDPIDL